MLPSAIYTPFTQNDEQHDGNADVFSCASNLTDLVMKPGVQRKRNENRAAAPLVSPLLTERLGLALARSEVVR